MGLEPMQIRTRPVFLINYPYIKYQIYFCITSKVNIEQTLRMYHFFLS